MTRYYIFFFILFIFGSSSCKKDDEQNPQVEVLRLNAIRVGTDNLQADLLMEDIAADQPMVATFSAALQKTSIEEGFLLKKEDGEEIALNFSYLDNDKTVSALPVLPLASNTIYELILANTISSTDGGQYAGSTFRFQTARIPLTLEAATISGDDLLQSGRITDVPQNFTILLKFSLAVSLSEVQSNTIIYDGDGRLLNLQITDATGDGRQFQISSSDPIDHLARYTLTIDEDLISLEDNEFEGFTKIFYTAIDETPKFPVISDEELLDLVQQQTFKYFWDFAHPVSGLARERNTSGDLVTSGGSGFGLMAIVVAMERGFITRQEGLDRLKTITDFLAIANRYHGAWPHWLNGVTGATIPFSPNDDGGDLVETSFLVMGLLTVRQYLDPNVNEENELIGNINTLWQGVEWDWYRQEGQDALYWHWSENFGWEKNHKIRGYNEAAITYILAASSPTFSIPAEVYHDGWANMGGMKNGNEYYGTNLPLGPPFGGPLFFEHYTFLGINPTMLSDTYANYWQQTVNHTLINRAHCVLNPNNYVGYSDKCWGLTASDNHEGYSAHSPTNDKGVITPTAALSSMPYTPEASMAALHHFYYTLGDKLWGTYGFVDAFNPTRGWVADSYLAIDQGPIIGMIENYRSGLLWELFMSCPEVQEGLTKLGFTY